MCLLDNREVRKGWEPLKEAVAGMFTKHGAKVLSNRRWDERRLAYPINGQNRATYLLLYFSTDTQHIPALRRELEFSEPMMRYLITECEEVPQDAYEPEADFDVDAIPVDDSAPEPEEPRARRDGGDDAPDEGEASSDGDDDSSDDADGDDADGDSGADDEENES